MKPELNKYDSLVFLDVDGVLNNELFYLERYAHLTRYDGIPLYKEVKKHLKKLVKKKEIDKLEYYKSEMCSRNMELLNGFCATTNSAVVLSASMRNGYDSIEELQEIFNYCGATFTIIDKTGYTGYARGTEIKKWLDENTMKWFGVHSFDFHKYVIFDDNDDFLINQAPHLFQTDDYCGLTHNTTNNARIFLTHKTF